MGIHTFLATFRGTLAYALASRKILVHVKVLACDRTPKGLAWDSWIGIRGCEANPLGQRQHCACPDHRLGRNIGLVMIRLEDFVHCMVRLQASV